MRSVGIKTLKNKLSEYVRLAAAGETVLVTDRDRVVAELVPPSESRAKLSADTRLAQAIREGVLTPARVVSGEPPPRVPIMSFATLMQQLAADREDR
jgi:prevent-host-death family protein